MSTAITIGIYTVLVFATSAIGSLVGIGGGVIRKPVFDLLGDFNASEIAFLNVVTVLAMSLVSILIQSKSLKPKSGAIALQRTIKVNASACANHGRTAENDTENVARATAELVTENVARATAENLSRPEEALSENKTMTSSTVARTKPRFKNLAFLSIGSVVGGVGGELIFASLVKGSPDTAVKLVQNAVLLVLTVLVFLYMIFQKKIPTARLCHPIWYVFAGLVLGILASFLGIGGGPMNLAVLMLMFSMSIKEAAYASLVVILVSQASKLILSAVSGTILAVTAPLVYTSVGFLIVGAVAGGLIGSLLSKRCSEKAVKIAFNLLQTVLIGIVVYNIAAAAANL